MAEVSRSGDGLTRDFEGKSAIVTGGASGIGAATVRELAQRGAHVVIADLAEDTGKELQSVLRSEGHSVVFVPTDVTREDDLAQAVRAAAEFNGGLDFGVNSAGGDLGKRNGVDIADLDAADWTRTIELSMTGVFLSMKQEILAMRPRGGAIVNVASMAGLRFSAGTSIAYHAAKAGVVHMTHWAAVQNGADNIRVNCVAPGLTLTPMVRNNTKPERLDEIVGQIHILHRPVEPQEQADAIAWLLSPKAAMITGTIVPVDGGWNAR